MEPEPRTPPGTPGRGCALRPGSSLARALSVHRRCNLPGPVPVPRRSFLGWTDLLAPTPARSGPRDLYSLGGGSSGAASESGGRAGRRRAALRAQVLRGGADARPGREGTGWGEEPAPHPRLSRASPAPHHGRPPPPLSPQRPRCHRVLGRGAGPARSGAPGGGTLRPLLAAARTPHRCGRAVAPAAPRRPNHLGRGWAKVRRSREEREEKCG